MNFEGLLAWVNSPERIPEELAALIAALEISSTAKTLRGMRTKLRAVISSHNMQEPVPNAAVAVTRSKRTPKAVKKGSNPPSIYDGVTVPNLRILCEDRKIVIVSRDIKADIIAKLLLYDETAHLPRTFRDPATSQVIIEEEALPVPPVDPEDDAMTHDPNHNQPDAGTALADFNTAINGIVSEYEKSTEDVSPAHKAITAIDARFIEFRNSFPNDSYALTSAEQAANSAKRTVDSTKSMRQNVRDDEALKAFDPPAPKPAPVKPFTATDIVDDYNNQEVTAEGARKRIDRELTSWIQANPNGDHSAARREAMNVKSEIDYLQRERDDAAQQAANDAKRGGGNGGGGNDNGNGHDDDDGDNGRRRGNGGNNAGAFAFIHNGNVGPWILGAAAVIALVVLGIGAIWALTRNNDGTTAASSGGTVDVDKIINSKGGNTSGTTESTSSTSALTSSGGSTGMQVVIGSGTAGGGPNTDAVNTGDCEVLQVQTDRIRIRSGVLGECTQTFSSLPKGWQMVVDSVDHTVNKQDCVGCTQGFELDNLGGTVTVRIHNGLAVLGTPDVVSDRYCVAMTEGKRFNHDNALNLLPLKSWATCN